MQRQLFAPLEEQAIEAIRTYAPKDGREVLVAYSGGKDSETLLEVVKRSGVPFHAVYRYCCLDPKELRAHVKMRMADPANHLSIAWPETSLIQIARKRGIMPLRNRRWCCEVIKEKQTDDPLTITGIRWAESARRRRRRRMEECHRVRGYLLNPLINWRNEDVWAYIRAHDLPCCSLYQEGFKRLGCVLCPMSDNVEREAERFPWAVKVWQGINQACWEEKGHRVWKTPEAMWQWWISRHDRAPDPDGADCPLFDGVLE